MKKLIIPFLILSVLFSFSIRIVVGQDTIHSVYYRNLINQLKVNPKIKEVKFVEKKYRNGQIAKQTLLVRYNIDSIMDKYFSIGKSYLYYKNGQLDMFYNVDIASGILKDTLFVYDKDGYLNSMGVFNNDTICAFSIMLLGKRSNYYVNFPPNYKEVIFKHSKIRMETPFSKMGEGYLINGIVKKFSPDGQIVSQDVYKMGVLQTPVYIPDTINDYLLNELPDSIITLNNLNGKVSKTVGLKNGKIIEQCNYDYSLMFNTKETYRNGMLHGPWVKTFKDGKKRENRFYYKGKPTGIWTVWDKFGVVLIETNWEGETVIRKTYEYSKKKKTIIIEELNKEGVKRLSTKVVKEDLN